MIQLLFAALGTLGFGLIFNANHNKLFYIAVGGFVNFLGYLVVYNLTSNIFMASASCAFVTSIYSMLMARGLKCPSTIFILTGLIPSVPGSSLFYMMQGIVLSNNNQAINSGVEVCLVVLGIVSGMALASVVFTIFKQISLPTKAAI